MKFLRENLWQILSVTWVTLRKIQTNHLHFDRKIFTRKLKMVDSGLWRLTFEEYHNQPESMLAVAASHRALSTHFPASEIKRRIASFAMVSCWCPKTEIRYLVVRSVAQISLGQSHDHKYKQPLQSNPYKVASRIEPSPLLLSSRIWFTSISQQNRTRCNRWKIYH